MSNEIKESMPDVIEEARKLGYHVDRMAVAGGAFGMIYAYRDGASPNKVYLSSSGTSEF